MSTYRVNIVNASGILSAASIKTQGSNTNVTADTSGQYAQIAVSSGAGSYFTNAFTNAACLKANNAILMGVGAGDYSIRVNTVSTASTTTTTGTLIVTGGVGITGVLYAGSISCPGTIGSATLLVANTDPAVTVNQSGNTMQMAVAGSNASFFSNSSTNDTIIKGTGTPGILIGTTGDYAVRINTVSTASTTPTTGTVIVTGGVGVTGNMRIAGTWKTNQTSLNINNQLLTYNRGTFTPRVHCNLDNVELNNSTGMIIRSADWVQAGKLVTVTADFSCDMTPVGIHLYNMMIIDIPGCPMIAYGTTSTTMMSDRTKIQDVPQTGTTGPVYISANGAQTYQPANSSINGYQLVPMQTNPTSGLSPVSGYSTAAFTQVFAFTISYFTP